MRKYGACFLLLFFHTLCTMEEYNDEYTIEELLSFRFYDDVEEQISGRPITRKKSIHARPNEDKHLSKFFQQLLPSVMDYHIGYPGLDFLIKERFWKYISDVQEYRKQNINPSIESCKNVTTILTMILALSSMHNHALTRWSKKLIQANSIQTDIAEYCRLIGEANQYIIKRDAYMMYQPLSVAQESHLFDLLLTITCVSKAYRSKEVSPESLFERLHEQFDTFKKSIHALPVRRKTEEPKNEPRGGIRFPKNFDSILLGMYNSFKGTRSVEPKINVSSVPAKSELPIAEKCALPIADETVAIVTSEKKLKEVCVSDILQGYEMIHEFLHALNGVVEELMHVPTPSEDLYAPSQNKQKIPIHGSLTSEKKHNKGRNSQGKTQTRKKTNKKLSKATACVTSENSSISEHNTKRGSGVKNPIKEKRIDLAKQAQEKEHTVGQAKNPVHQFYSTHKNIISKITALGVITILLLRIAWKEGYLAQFAVNL